MATPKPVSIVVVNACKVDGKHLAVGDVLLDVEPDLAFELTGAGRTRLATAEDLAAAKKKPAKAEA
jgi:hypothetical protein